MQAMQDGQVKYTLSRGTGPLREAIVSKLRGHNSIPASTDEVVVTTGGTTAVLETLLVLLRVGDGVLIPDPGWPSFDMIVTLLRGRALRYGLRAEADYTPDLEEVERLAPDARVLVINTPSNPTGAVFTRETLEGLIRIAERHGLVIVSDEVYEDIVFDGTHSSVASLGGDAPVVSVFSFSKGYAMTGWRIGYLAAPAAIAEAVVKAQEAVVACPPSLAQHAALAALSGSRDCIDEMRERVPRAARPRRRAPRSRGPAPHTAARHLLHHGATSHAAASTATSSPAGSSSNAASPSRLEGHSATRPEPRSACRSPHPRRRSPKGSGASARRSGKTAPTEPRGLTRS